jgi:gluconolactonase
VSNYLEPTGRLERLNIETGAVEVIRNGATGNMPNGQTFSDKLGRIVTCEQGHLVGSSPAAITLTDPRNPGQPQTVYVSEAQSKLNEDGATTALRLNSPNDVVEDPVDGAIWFTDPSYGFLQEFRPPAVAQAILRVDPTDRSLTRMMAWGGEPHADGLNNKPNGLLFSKDGSTLYWTNTAAGYPGKEFSWERAHSVWQAKIVREPGAPPSVDKATIDKICDVKPLAHVDGVVGIPDGLKLDADDLSLLTSAGQELVTIDPRLRGEAAIVKRLHLNLAQVTNMALSPDKTSMVVCGDDRLVLLSRKELNCAPAIEE